MILLKLLFYSSKFFPHSEAKQEGEKFNLERFEIPEIHDSWEKTGMLNHSTSQTPYSHLGLTDVNASQVLPASDAIFT